MVLKKQNKPKKLQDRKKDIKYVTIMWKFQGGAGTVFGSIFR